MSQYYAHRLPKDFFLFIQSGRFRLNFDKAELLDISLIVEGLKILPCISCLELEGSPSQSSRPAKSSLNKTVKVQISKLAQNHSLYNLGKLLEGFSFNFQNKGCLVSLKIQGFHFDSKAWIMMNHCLKVVVSLAEIQITKCDLRDEDLNVFSNGIDLKELGKIDLSFNLLENDGCDIVSRVISRVNSCQVELEWSHGLRNGHPAPQLGGLREVNLSHNKITDKGLINLTHGLFYDDFVKVLDLSGNLLTSSSFQEIFNLLQTNSALIIVNLLENSKTQDSKIISGIIDKLYENFQRNHWKFDEIKWLKMVEDVKLCIFYAGGKEKDVKEKIKKGLKRIGLGSHHKELHLRGDKKILVGCDKCELFERELFKSKSQCVDLKIQNNLLQKKLENSGNRKVE
jgi:hypothetical protein